MNGGVPRPGTDERSPSLRERIVAWARALKRDAVTLWFALRHPATPWVAKGIAFVVVAYALSPIDLIPDFIPVLGFLDDAILLPGLVWVALRLIPASVKLACRAQADRWIAEGNAKPRSRIGVVLVLSAWGIACVALWMVAARAVRG